MSCQQVFEGQILEGLQRQRARILAAESRGILVDLVLKSLDRGEDWRARFRAYRWIARYSARRRRLRDAGKFGDVKRGGMTLTHGATE